MATGLVKTSISTDTTKNRMTCTRTGAPQAAAIVATRAPAANQIVVSPIVASSISTSKINRASQANTSVM